MTMETKRKRDPSCTPAVRAEQLVRIIEEAVERGLFTFDHGYLDNGNDELNKLLFMNLPVGACGCALAAAATVTGIDVDDSSNSNGREPLIDYLKRQGMTEGEALSLEAGYEGGTRGDVEWEREDPGSVVSEPFFRAGRELRKFHP